MKWVSGLKGSLKIILRQVLIIVVSLLLASVFLGLTGYDPFAILAGMWRGMTVDLAGTIRWATPLILAGLAICITFKAQVWNLGVDGQINVGAAAATAVALYLHQGNQFISVVIVFLAAMAAGMILAIIPALLKVFFDTNEVVSTLLLNFISVLFISYLVVGPMRDPNEVAILNASEKIPAWTWLPRIKFFNPSPANWGFYIALAAVLVIAFIFYKTKLGYEIKIVGANPDLAFYSGMKPKQITISVMAISGALAGIIGAIEVTAVQHKLITGFNPSFGFDGIVASLLANNNPLGVVLSALFFGNLKNAGITMERLTDVPSAMTNIVQAIIILTITANYAIPKLNKIRKNFLLRKISSDATTRK